VLVLKAGYPELHRIADQLEPRLRRVLLDAFDTLQQAVPTDEVTRLLEAGNVEAVLGVLRDASVLPANVAAEIEGVLADGAVRSLRTVGVDLDFTVVDAAAVSWASRHAGDLITGISEETRLAVRGLVESALRGQMPPRTLARHVASSVGLTEAWAGASTRYFDGLLEAGMELGRAERLRDRYAARLLRRRGINIARTETIKAAVQGRLEGWRQAAGSGLFVRETARMVWVVTPDDRLCRSCAVLDGTTVGFDERFRVTERAETVSVAGSGPMRDRVTVSGRVPLREPVVVDGPPLHPSCRCSIELQVTDTMGGSPGWDQLDDDGKRAMLERDLSGKWPTHTAEVAEARAFDMDGQEIDFTRPEGWAEMGTTAQAEWIGSNVPGAGARFSFTTSDNVPLEVSLTGMDPEAARRATSEIARLADRYPEAARSIHRIDTRRLREGVSASAVPSDHALLFNSELWGDLDGLESALWDAQRAGFNVTGNIEGTVRHEFGHVVDVALRDTGPGREARQFFREAIDEGPGMQTWGARHLSTYATQDGAEAFAEAFALISAPDLRRTITGPQLQTLESSGMMDTLERLRGLIGAAI
jgi:hypothetical protein